MASLLHRLACVLPIFSLMACATTLVQPYDEKLVNDTGQLYKKAVAMVEDGIAKSSQDAKGPPASRPGHVSRFESRYRDLDTDADLLILEALANSRTSSVGEKIQSKVDDLISKNLPSTCEELDTEFKRGSSSLTVKNYVDLKCLLMNWQKQHEEDKDGVLNPLTWELRKRTLFNATYAILKAESVKKK
ncbi:hypothetical protein [Duganella sp. Root198D2]|uniref:hypothetical protein n=1 Tax=Duganella sp. Root198D2 TaxID=1736489 RepID=UPI0007093A0A|nr:hypothetical protein [Duganella sp. Root198D2]KRC02302.1 hypothetical protein ASE26_19810 [Duganella sp. Root198D2]